MALRAEGFSGLIYSPVFIFLGVHEIA